MKRYQDCAPLVRAWRRRHMLRVPYDAIRYRLLKPDFVDYRWDVAWHLALGEADLRMNYLYDF